MDLVEILNWLNENIGLSVALPTAILLLLIIIVTPIVLQHSRKKTASVGCVPRTI